MKHIYLILTIIGGIIPYSFFGMFLWQYGLDIELFFSQTFSSFISTFWTIDVILSAITLIIWILVSGKNLGLIKYVPIFMTLTVGVSCGLPLFLYLQETKNNL